MPLSCLAGPDVKRHGTLPVGRGPWAMSPGPYLLSSPFAAPRTFSSSLLLLLLLPLASSRPQRQRQHRAPRPPPPSTIRHQHHRRRRPARAQWTSALRPHPRPVHNQPPPDPAPSVDASRRFPLPAFDPVQSPPGLASPVLNVNPPKQNPELPPPERARPRPRPRILFAPPLSLHPNFPLRIATYLARPQHRAILPPPNLHTRCPPNDRGSPTHPCATSATRPPSPTSCAFSTTNIHHAHHHQHCSPNFKTPTPPRERQAPPTSLPWDSSQIT